MGYQTFEDAQRHCWTATEARAFLTVAKDAGEQRAAFYSLGLDAERRKGELCGALWEHLDLDAGKWRIVHPLLKPGPKPTFGPTKTGRPRTVSLSPESVALLRQHRAHQRELKMANRSAYSDHGLVFAKEWTDLKRGKDTLGHPLQMNNLGEREWSKLVAAAGVRRIKPHGMRHTCATLLLQAGQPIHVVSERLGHSSVTMTMEIYAYVLPDMQQSAAERIGSLLHG